MKSKVKVKVKITNDDDVLVKVPYKNGFVTWRLLLRAKFEWEIFEKVDKYQPVRVREMHRAFLNGKTVGASIRKTAAAMHRYKLLDQLSIYTFNRI